MAATDGLHTARAQVHVNVKDINDNAPFFPHNVIEASVLENANAGEYEAWKGNDGHTQPSLSHRPGAKVTKEPFHRCATRNFPQACFFLFLSFFLSFFLPTNPSCQFSYQFGIIALP